MNFILLNRSIGTWCVAIVAVVFGFLTIRSGGLVLFVDGIAREAAGHYVAFVLWSNFFMGFAYILAGVGLFFRYIWAAKLSILIAAVTVLVFLALGWYIFDGGAYEVRTVVAMSLRTIIWAAIAVFAYKKHI